MIDGGFRENVYGAGCFVNQDFPKDQFEVLWIEHFDKLHTSVRSLPGIKAKCLNQPGGYHSSTCFNYGITSAKGEVVVIPDADQIVPPDFLKRVWEKHQEYERLVVYGYRLDQISCRLTGKDKAFELFEEDYMVTNPVNYGGCLTVRKKWLLEINGYEQHAAFATGAHANGKDLYTRFKNYGLSICWDPDLKLYHPWHKGTLIFSPWHKLQLEIVDWRSKSLNYMALNGIDPSKNCDMPEQLYDEVEAKIKNMREMQSDEFPHIM